MKVTILTKADYAGSGFKLYNALKEHTDHDLFFGAICKTSKFGHPKGNIIGKRSIPVVQERIAESDIIHLKGDWPPVDNTYKYFNLLDKKVVVTVGGSFFRKRKYTGQEKWTMDYYDRVDLKTSFTPDLLYPEFSDIWTPHPIDSSKKKNEWKLSDPPIFITSPTSRSRKHTHFILAVFEKLKKRFNFKVRFIEKVPFEEAVETRKEATIFFDQYNPGCGFYGNSAIEAMQFGIPVCCYLSPMTLDQAKGKLDDCPVISYPALDVDAWVNMLGDYLNNIECLKDISQRTKEWCDRWHSYESIAKQWDELYQGIFKDR